MFRSLPAWSFLIALFPVCLSAEESKTVDFNRDIRPILSDKCFQCHGPDDKSRKAKLRLDIRESAVGDSTGLDARPDPVKSEKVGVIVPGHADASELVARLLTTDPDEIMPPAKVKKPISKKEIELLSQWIEEGAPYDGHWSFRPLADAELPAVKAKSWVKNGIDHFILAQLEQKKIAPSPEADPSTLIRRMSLDLVGLLPEPERVKRFVADYGRDHDKAVAALADELLASPHYGERWGRHWLDQARYADSNGYTIDGERTMWPYRDWVIRAINDDLPFDQFTIEQLAGDLLPNPTKAQLVASGFHRNTLINQEGGTDNEQFRNEEVVDRVNTTGAVWMGLTLGCAQCHTHKFDPITQKEYFEMFAFFNQGDDVNNVGATVEVSEGEMFLRDPDPKLLGALDQAKAALAALDRDKVKRQEAWEKSLIANDNKDANAPGASWARVKPTKLSAEGGAKLELQKGDSILAGAGGPHEVYRVELAPAKEAITAIRLKLIPHASLPNQGPGRAGNGNIVLTRVEFFQNGKPLTVARAQHDHAQPGFSAAFTIDGKTDTGWAINVGKGTAPGVKMNAEHEAHYVFAEPILASGGPVEVVLRHEANANYNIGHFAFDVSPTAPGAVTEEKLLTTLKIAPADRSDADKKLLTAEFDKADSERRAAVSRIAEAQKAIGLGSSVKTMVMRDLATPRESFIHIRGDFLRHDTETGPLRPNVLAALPAMPDSAKEKALPNRLDLAQWLVRADHPLTPRVTANRVWMRYFGKGIVETENDFGTQGSFPTHPELLDWLARSLIEGGWSMKALHKTIVTSATYRQSSMARPELNDIDPLNHLLSRQNRIRVEAEIVRDAALSASGLFTEKIGGPGVKPPQPEGVYAFTQRKVSWVAAEGPDRYRRAMYTQFYRSAPYPLLTTFDSPDFQSVCTGRVRSNTPLQSLTLANDEAMIELAQGLSARLMQEIGGTDSVANRERIRRAFGHCFSREPSEAEVEAVVAFQEKQMAGFAADAEGAKAVAPEKWAEGFDVAAAASWTAVARALMNTDEFITRE
ncbi:MAG: PSD1 domain-containing protein [Verrucomicrobiae bacterium]|nr:PSD1 domain-containing protein [Verrucomicrobiae bacterium]